MELYKTKPLAWLPEPSLGSIIKEVEEEDIKRGKQLYCIKDVYSGWILGFYVN